MEFKISLNKALRIIYTNKTFVCFNLDKNNNVKEYVCTNDLHRYYKKEYSNFRLVSIAKQNFLNNTKI